MRSTAAIRAISQRGRRLLEPSGATAAIVVLSGLGLAAGIVVGGLGWLPSWLLLGLVAGYALSGSV